MSSAGSTGVLYDHPGAGDCSELTGLLGVDGHVKEWGKTFHDLSLRYTGTVIPPKKIGPRPEMDWDACITSSGAADKFRKAYREKFLVEHQ